MSLKIFIQISATLVLAAFAYSPANSQSDFGHFHPKGKPPSEHTLKIFEEAAPSILIRSVQRESLDWG